MPKNHVKKAASPRATPSKASSLVTVVDEDGNKHTAFKDSKRMDTVVCETDLVPEDDERALFEGGDRVKIYIASANVGNAAIKEMDTWLPVNAPHTDVVVFGLQESTYGTAEIDTGSFGAGNADGLTQMEREGGDKHLQMMMQKQVGPEFVLLQEKKRGQMRLRIYVRMELLGEVSDVETGAENTGLGHVLANKGGQAIKFVLRGTSFVFVSSHLAAHESAEKCMRRNEDVAEIFHGVRFGNKKYDLMQFDHVFWNGDLNYRVEVPSAALKDPKTGKPKFPTPRALVMDLVQKNSFAELWEMDELQREIKAGRVFANFRTPRANFKPTFKVMRTNGGPRGNATTYNPKRIPSYCDRIVWSSAKHLVAPSGDAKLSVGGAKDSAVQCHRYDGCHAFATSDHKPILGRFSVAPSPELQVVNQPTFLKIKDEFDSSGGGGGGGGAAAARPSAAEGGAAEGAEVNCFSHYPQLRFFDLSAEGLFALDVGLHIMKKKKAEAAANASKSDNATAAAAAATAAVKDGADEDEDDWEDDDSHGPPVEQPSSSGGSEGAARPAGKMVGRSASFRERVAPGWEIDIARSDPYVVVETHPPALSAAKRPVKTEVQWQTLDPTWTDTPVLSLRATDFEGLTKGSIVLTILDHDTYGSHDVIGQVKFSFQELAAAAAEGGGIFAFERDVVHFGLVHGVLRGKIEVNIPAPDGSYPFAKRCIDDPCLESAPIASMGCCSCSVS